MLGEWHLLRLIPSPATKFARRDTRQTHFDEYRY